jgi:hypothetical protein
MGMGVAVTVAAGAVVVGVSLGASAGSGDSLTVQVKADLTEAIAALAKIGFRSTPSTSPSSGTACAASATGEVRQFLMRYPCKEYASTTLMARRQGATAQVVISWVVMPTLTLAEHYKTKADAPQLGNPPGEPLAFNGLCYASGQNGATVWTEQVQPTGHVNTDREVLQAAAPRKLTLSYLQQHCRA